MSKRDWWKTVAIKVHRLRPYAVHLEHEYGLYEYYDSRGHGDGNEGFLDLLDAINEFPTIVEPHTIHGRLTSFEANFIYQMCERARVVLVQVPLSKMAPGLEFRRARLANPQKRYGGPSWG